MKASQTAYYASVVENRFQRSFWTPIHCWARGRKKDCKTAEENLLCLYRQAFNVVKIAVCQVRTCTRKRLEKLSSTLKSWKNRRGNIFFFIISVLPNIDHHQEVLTSLKFCSKFRRRRHCSSFCWCLIQNSSKAVSVSCNWARSLK